jgi:hypothetical protein
MSTPPFIAFKDAVARQFDRMAKQPLFRTATVKHEVWTTYLASFPPGSDPH